MQVCREHAKGHQLQLTALRATPGCLLAKATLLSLQAHQYHQR
jgi:hypothetical protein